MAGAELYQTGHRYFWDLKRASEVTTANITLLNHLLAWFDRLLSSRPKPLIKTDPVPEIQVKQIPQAVGQKILALAKPTTIGSFQKFVKEKIEFFKSIRGRCLADGINDVGKIVVSKNEKDTLAELHFAESDTAKKIEGEEFQIVSNLGPTLEKGSKLSSSDLCNEFKDLKDFRSFLLGYFALINSKIKSKNLLPTIISRPYLAQQFSLRAILLKAILAINNNRLLPNRQQYEALSKSGKKSDAELKEAIDEKIKKLGFYDIGEFHRIFYGDADIHEKHLQRVVAFQKIDFRLNPMYTVRGPDKIELAGNAEYLAWRQDLATKDSEGMSLAKYLADQSTVQVKYPENIVIEQRI